uniref:Uncharacterized protein n=1 Tax=Myoviridae sp. cteo515 TaxID=2823550 RepID=A0A8S5LBE8_9CAUD|nr:MAG TPA: hypothetical protein [Myoviridae sp. cteo515]
MVNYFLSNFFHISHPYKIVLFLLTLFTEIFFFNQTT